MNRTIRLLLVSVLALVSMTAFSQAFRDAQLSGRVLDEKGEPLPGALVASADAKRGAMTDVDGNFKMKLLASDKTITVSYLGYVAQTVNVSGKDVVTVVMVPDEKNSLNEAVVIGYGEVKKADLTGSVTSVKMSDVTESATLSVGQALQGRVAGVDVMSTTGEPGAGTSVRIRGTRSINASNEPLIIVDGVMDLVSNLAELNPDDIESISLLKDASSTAIYGSRGSNGVIMVKTKGGTTAKPRIKANAQFGVSHLARSLDLMNAQEFIRYRNDYYRYKNNGSQYRYDPSEYGEGTDWQDAITRVALFQNYNVSMSGKVDKMDFYASLGYTDEQGIVKGSDHKRLTARMNFGYQIAKWLKFSYQGAYTFRRQNPNKANIGGTNIYNAAMYLSPVIGPYDEFNPLYDNGARIDTPVTSLERRTNLVDRHDLTNAITFDIKPIKGLHIKSKNTFKTYQRHDYKFWPNTLTSRLDEQGSKAERYESDNMRFMSDNTIKYDRNFRGGHHFDILGGFTLSYLTANAMTVTADGMLSDDLKWYNMNAIQSKENYSISSSFNKQVKESFLGRLNYNYNGRYYLTVTARWDGSSNFAANQKWGFFPSAAFKWTAKKEKFIRQVKWIDNLALRLSIGRTGNDAISTFLSNEHYGSHTDKYVFDGTQPIAMYINRLANPDLTWEKTTLANLGIDFAVLDNRIQITAEAYASVTRDLLLYVQTAQSTGYKNRLQNLGQTSNKGLEISIETRNIVRKKFQWLTTLTLSHNTQMVDDIGNEEYVSVMDAGGNNAFMMYGYKSGYPLNALWGLQYAGPWRSQDEIDRNKYTQTYASVLTQTPGTPKYVDQDQDGVITQDDLIYLGTSDPYIYGGLQNNFHIGKLKLSIYFTYSLGGKMYNFAELYNAGGSNTNQFRYMLDAWHPVRNPEGWYPRAGTDDQFPPSTLMLHDASYLRLKTAQLAYTFDFKKSKVFRNITVSLKGDNLWLLTKYNGYDPDVSTESDGSVMRRVDKGAYPKARSFILGVQMNF